MADDKKLPADHDHWLVRESTIRNLWILLIAVFVLSIAAETVWHPHPHFSLDAIFGFGAWFGLLSGFALVVVTKSWAIFVKRKDTYYD
ncbi:MAG: hypothetical protein KDJ62_07345 [Rhodobiaceae bacterium]|nr:hypothetical protein [Rhodobiaceae bacterium]MCC0048505.1 hypothetical protein [Rhodobiaceae bacterium]